MLDDVAAESNYPILEEQDSALGVEVVRVDFAEADAILNAASAALAPHLGAAIEASNDRGVAFLSSNHRTDLGAFLGYEWVNQEVGEDLARWVADLLDGTPVEDLPFGAFRLSLSFNLDIADAPGIEIPSSLCEQAAFTYP